MRQDFTFLSRSRSYQLSPHTGSYDMRLPQVAHSEHQAQLAVSLAHDGVFGEQKRLRSVLGARHLSEHYANHEGLNHHTHNTL